MPRSRPEFLKPGEQLILAVEAAVRVVLHVVWILELTGWDELVAEAALARELRGIPLVRFGNRCRIRSDRQRVLAQSQMRCPGQISRVGAAGIGHHHALKRLEKLKQLSLFLD